MRIVPSSIHSFLMILALLLCNYTSTIKSFEKTFGLGTGYAVKVDSKNNIVIASGYFTGGNTAIGIITKIDENGTEIWRHEVNHDSLVLIKDMDIDEDDNIYVSGSFSRMYDKIFIAKLNSSGKEIWIKQFSGNGYHAARNIKINKHCEAFICRNDYTILKFNENFENYDLQQIKGKILLTINTYIFDHAGNFVTVGHDQNAIEVYRVDQSGEILNEYKYEEENFIFGVDLVMLDNGHIAILGKTKIDYQNDTHNLFVALLDFDLKPIWTKEVPQDYAGNNYMNIENIKNNLIISTTFNKKGSSNYYDAQLLKLNLEGDIIAKEYFGARGSDMPFDLVVHKDKIIFTGQKSDSIWLVTKNLNDIRENKENR